MQIRTNRDWSKKADAAPSRGKVGADQVAIEGRAKSGDMRRPAAAVNIVAICPEGFRIRGAKKRAERHSEDAFGLRQVVLGEGRNHGLEAYVFGGCRHPLVLLVV